MREISENKPPRPRAAAALPRSLLLFAAAISSWVRGAVAATRDLETSWPPFDATVLSPQERQAAAPMIEEDARRRLRGSNERSSAEWKNITSRAEWERFRASTLAALRDSLGQPAMPGPLRQRVTGTVGGEGYRIDNTVFQSRSGLWITANLYRPDKPRPRMPGILISHAQRTPKEHGELHDMALAHRRKS